MRSIVEMQLPAPPTAPCILVSPVSSLHSAFLSELRHDLLRKPEYKVLTGETKGEGLSEVLGSNWPNLITASALPLEIWQAGCTRFCRACAARCAPAI